MEQKNGHQHNEMTLFHGTSEDTVAIINEHGFNRSYAGKNGEKFRPSKSHFLISKFYLEVTPVLSAALLATCFGKGTYFAVHASYSAQDIYSKPNQNGEKHMYLCRVLTGDYTLGQKDMVAPPPKAANSVELYDSVVNDKNNPHIFVVFHDNLAYPEYMIKFK